VFFKKKKDVLFKKYHFQSFGFENEDFNNKRFSRFFQK